MSLFEGQPEFIFLVPAICMAVTGLIYPGDAAMAIAAPGESTVFPESVDPVDMDDPDAPSGTSGETIALDLDINRAGINDLMELPGMTRSDAILIVKTKKKNGPFASVRQAASTEGLSPPASDAIKIYGKVKKRRTDWSVTSIIGGAWHSNNLNHFAPVYFSPDVAAGIRASWLGRWEAGISLVVTPGASSVHSGQIEKGTGLVAQGPGPVFDPATFFLTYEGDDFSVTAGTFQVGFGTGLTIDTTGLSRPDGIRIPPRFTVNGSSGNIRKKKRFSGCAVEFDRKVSSDGQKLHGAIFLSYGFIDPPRSDITWDRCPAGTLQADCTDSRKMPFVIWSDSSAAAEKTSWLTMTDTVRQAMAGAALGTGNDRWDITAIGWGTGLRFRPDVKDMQSSVSSAMPEDRRIFGAAGIAATVAIPGNGDFVAEAAVNDRGTPAAVAQASFSPVKGLDLEPSIRWYHRSWDNPWTGSTADAPSFRGNRARNELGARMDMAWRSSRLTANRFRLDMARHGAGDTTGSRAAFDLEIATGLQIFASGKERIGVEIGYRDRDLTRWGRGLSWSSYYSNATGNLSGGCGINWAAGLLTTRIPRTRLSVRLAQTFKDTATLNDAFDMNMSASLRLQSKLTPGPVMAVFIRWFDESMIDDTSPSSRQGCAGIPTGTVIPGECRGDSAVETGISLDQIFAAGPGTIRIRLGFRYTRHVDRRLKWEDPEPGTSRNEFVSTLFVETVHRSNHRPN